MSFVAFIRCQVWHTLAFDSKCYIFILAPVNIKATITPAVAPGSGSPVRANAPSSIRSPEGQRLFGGQLANSLAGDLEGFTSAINDILQKLQTAPQMSQLLLTNTAGEIIAAVGNLVYAGVRYTNYFNELHVGNPLQTRDPQQSLFNANLDGSVSIGQNGWFDVHDPYDGNAAWIGTQFDTLLITGSTNNGSGLIRLQVTGHTLVTGNSCQVRNMQLAGVPNATGQWTVTAIDANHIDLQNSVWAGLFVAPANPSGINTSAPTIDRVLQVIGASSAGGLIELHTNVPHTYETGDRVNVPSAPGVPNAVGQWTVVVVDATHIKLTGSTFAGALTGNGTCLRYFSGVLAEQIAIGPSFQNYLLRGFADGSLRIRNATISLTAGSSSIVLDPSVPSIVLTASGGSTIVIDAATSNMIFTSSIGSIEINAITGQITIKNGASVTTASLNTAGALVATSLSIPGGVTGVVTSPFTSLTFTNGILTGYAP